MAKAKGSGAPKGGGRGPAPPSGGKPTQAKPGKARRTPLQAFLYWSAVAAAAVVIFIAAFLAVFAYGLPDTSKLYQVQRQPSISYLDRSGGLVAVRGSQVTPPVKIDELPRYVPQAFVAIEDRRFYRHYGIDPIGIARAVLTNVLRRGVTQGGSTITQQLAKNLFLTQERTLGRQIHEAVPALLSVYKLAND